MRIIILSEHEVQSNLDRVKQAEGLITQLPKDHDGRNTWMLNFGISPESFAMRMVRDIRFSEITLSALGVEANKDVCQCDACRVVVHTSDCAVHNEPAETKGECNCPAKRFYERLPEKDK